MRGKTLSRNNGDSLILLFILLLGTILRLYRLQYIPFTHDEFSALFRTRFDSFADLINQGVRNDGHPAGIQVFLYYWVKLFGEGEVAVKIPFILSGILSIYLIYRLGREWFNPLVGLISAACVSGMECTIMYSQIAQPYISGLMLVLIMVMAWTRYLFRPGKHQYRHLGVLVLTGSLCTYNHHFSLLFMALVGVSGLFFLNRRTRIPYLISMILIIVLYIPHISIFLDQLSRGGVEGWLGKPSNDFILQYIAYLFHYSWPVYILVTGIILFGVISRDSIRFYRNRYFILSVAWFLIPFLAGFFYSKYVNSVLQYSVLIFSFPFFVFSIFSMVPDWRGWHRPVLVSMVCLSLFGTLFLQRRYYDLFYRSRFKEFILETDRTLQEYGRDNCLVIMDSASAGEYYFRFQNDFNGEARFWSEGLKSKYSDTLGYGDNNAYLMDGEQEFSPTFNRQLRSILVHRNDLIDVSLAVRDLDSLNTSLLVVVLNDGNRQISWTASQFEWYKPPGSDWYRVYHTFRPAVDGNLKPLEVHVYVWNKDLQRYYMDDFRIDTRTGNSGLFGLLEKI